MLLISFSLFHANGLLIEYKLKFQHYAIRDPATQAVKKHAIDPAI